MSEFGGDALFGYHGGAPVRDGDAVLMPSGHHPNVAVPGHRIAFL